MTTNKDFGSMPVSALTIRDHIAMSTMEGVLFNSIIQVDPIYITEQAYRIADAMLETRGNDE